MGEKRKKIGLKHGIWLRSSVLFTRTVAAVSRVRHSQTRRARAGRGLCCSVSKGGRERRPAWARARGKRDETFLRHRRHRKRQVFSFATSLWRPVGRAFRLLFRLLSSPGCRIRRFLSLRERTSETEPGKVLESGCDLRGPERERALVPLSLSLSLSTFCALLAAFAPLPQASPRAFCPASRSSMRTRDL